MEQTSSSLVIIGAGPSALTTAIYTTREDIPTTLYERGVIGGMAAITDQIDNYPGFAEGIAGMKLSQELQAQAERFGAQIEYGEASSLKRDGDEIELVIDGKPVRSKTVLLATGSNHRQLGVPGEQELIGQGVSTCATCDGFFFRDQDIAVIGGGDSAMEEATFLTRFARSVTLIHRRDEFRASRIMLERAQANEKITFVTNTEVVAVEGDSKVSGLLLRNTATGEESKLPVTGVFVAIGHDPRSGLVRDLVDLDDEGYVQVKGRTTSTSLDGVFAAGDLVDHTYRQAITAAGSGCAAAIDAERWLAEHHG